MNEENKIFNFFKYDSKNPINVRSSKLFKSIKIVDLTFMEGNESKELLENDDTLWMMEISHNVYDPDNEFQIFGKENSRMIAIIDLKNQIKGEKTFLLSENELKLFPTSDISFYIRNLNSRKLIDLDKYNITYLITYILKY